MLLISTIIFIGFDYFCVLLNKTTIMTLRNICLWALAMSIGFSTNLFGQTDTLATDTIQYWTVKGNAGLNLNQVALVNWAPGGQSSIGINAGVNFESKYEKDKFSWLTKSILNYGMQRLGKQEFRKSDDIIDFTSTLNLVASKHWKYSLMKNFRSQFVPGYEYDDELDTKTYVSRFLSPAYTLVSLGMEYSAPKYFRVLLSPVTHKAYIVTSDFDRIKTAFGVDSGKVVTHNVGAYIKANFEAEVFKNVTLATQLELFSNYLENPQNVDIIWGTKIIMKVNAWLNVTLQTDLVYDDDIMVPKTRDDGTTYMGKGTQFRENLAVGISYIFDNAKK